MRPKHGYDLVAALREEAKVIATDERAELVRNAADEIVLLIEQNKALQSKIDAAVKAASW